MALQFQGFSSTAQLVSGPITKDPGIVYSGYTTDVDLTVPGAKPDRFYIVVAPSLEANLGIVNCYCPSNDIVRIRLGNFSVGNIDPGSQTFYVLGM